VPRMRDDEIEELARAMGIEQAGRRSRRRRRRTPAPKRSRAWWASGPRTAVGGKAAPQPATPTPDIVDEAPAMTTEEFLAGCSGRGEYER
jgi:hypothetical protein